jgi:hypothetical protein
MPGFFGSHAVEECGGRWEVLSQTLGKISVDPFVFLLQGNGKRQDLFLRQTVEISHGCSVRSSSVAAQARCGSISA